MKLFSGIPKKRTNRRPVNKGMYEPSRLCKVYELDLEDTSIANIPRAGVLFYTIIDSSLHICFGRDAKTGDLTDFGGGRKASESPVQCAAREGNEESRFVFSHLRVDKIQGFYCLYSSNMLIVFIPVASPNDRDIRELTASNFNEKHFLSKSQSKSRSYNEVADIEWLNEEQIANLFSTRPTKQLFAKVRRFICSCTEISQNIERMRNVLTSVITTGEETYSELPKDSRLNIWMSSVVPS